MWDENKQEDKKLEDTQGTHPMHSLVGVMWSHQSNKDINKTVTESLGLFKAGQRLQQLLTPSSHRAQSSP